MTILACILFAVGCIVAIAGELRFTVITWRHGPTWFFACLFLPLADWLFLLLYFEESWRPALVSTLGLIVAAVGCWIGGLHFL